MIFLMQLVLYSYRTYHLVYHRCIQVDFDSRLQDLVLLILCSAVWFGSYLQHINMQYVLCHSFIYTDTARVAPYRLLQSHICNLIKHVSEHICSVPLVTLHFKLLTLQLHVQLQVSDDCYMKRSPICGNQLCPRDFVQSNIYN